MFDASRFTSYRISVSEFELAVETGKIALVPSKAELSGPMSDYCAQLCVPHGRYSVWVQGEPNGPRQQCYDVERVVLQSAQAADIADGRKLLDIDCFCRWLLIGDLTFVHSKGMWGGQERDPDYRAGMASIRRHRGVGGSYRLASGYDAAVVRLSVKEARIPVSLLVVAGKLQSFTLHVADAQVCENTDIAS